ncbi:MAG TPA: hypothetical protein VNL74_03920 [Methylococcus sp.]|nr:hypothetical protein [Methylococcus sp.]
MDLADRAQQVEEWDREIRVANLRANPPEAEPVGVCLYCGATLPEGRRWCDADCRDDWERVRDRA